MLGDYLSTGLGVLGLSWQSSPALTELEEVVTDWVRQMVGLSDGLERRHPGHGLDQHPGRPALRPRADLRTTRWPAAACRPRHGRSSSTSPRRATARSRRRRCSPASGATTSAASPTDERYAMRPEALAAAIRADIAARPDAVRRRRHHRHDHHHGARSGGRDRRAWPAEHGLWLHVDAAMAGSAMILPECRWMWEGIEGADSLVLNAHKWLGAAFDCSLYYVRDPQHLVRVMSTNPSLPAERRGRPGEEPARLGHPAGPPLPRARSSGA